VETIIFKAPAGTRARLKKIRSNVSALLRELTEQALHGNPDGVSAHDKARHLILPRGSGVKHLATRKDYVKQYGQKKHR
jgi:hypothetical protein